MHGSKPVCAGHQPAMWSCYGARSLYVCVWGGAGIAGIVCTVCVIMQHPAVRRSCSHCMYQYTLTYTHPARLPPAAAPGAERPRMAGARRRGRHRALPAARALTRLQRAGPHWAGATQRVRRAPTRGQRSCKRSCSRRGPGSSVMLHMESCSSSAPLWLQRA